MRVLLATYAALVLLQGCTIERHNDLVLPWFRYQITTYNSIWQGGGGGTSQGSYFVKGWIFWRKLNVHAGGEPIALDAHTVLFLGPTGVQLIREGDTRWRAACEPGSRASIGGAGTYDCTSVITSSTRDRVHRIRVRRRDASGRVLFDERLDAGLGRTFASLGGKVDFYDSQSQPYFIAWSGERDRPECRLVAISPSPTVLEGSALKDCWSKEEWQTLLQQPLAAN